MSIYRFIFTFLLFTQFGQAQQIIGFWEITDVQVGEETMTPVAKWTRINADHTFQSGNGWLQNSAGTWTYDQNKHTFSPNDPNDIVDEFGAFTVSFEGVQMIWKRMEEGIAVTVTLEPISELPQAPADEVVGLWDLTNATEQGDDVTASFDADGQHYLFIRWDRIYIERTPQGERSTGYWHMHGHRPHLTLMSHDAKRGIASWEIAVADSKLTMTGISDSNKDKVLTYNRIHEFPK